MLRAASLPAGLLQVLPQPWITTAWSQPEHPEQNWYLSYPDTQSKAPPALSKLPAPATLQN